MRIKQVIASLAALTFATPALLAIMAVTGCTSQQQGDVQKAEANLAQNADQIVTFAQQQLTLAQTVASAYQAQLAALPPGDKSAAKTQANLAKAQAEVAKWQIYLSLAKVGIKVVEAQTPPATQPTTP